MTAARRAPGTGVIDSGGMEIGSPQYERLKQHYLFSGLEKESFDTLAETVAVREFRQGKVLFQRGDPAEWFCFVESGQVELSLDARSGESKTLEVIGPGRTFAEAVAFMGKVSYPVTASVLADCTVFQIPIRGYLRLLQASPEACMRLLGDVCTHLHARVREIERLTFQNARSRLVSYLLDHVVESDADADEATIRLELPRHVIASRLSITPETLSRLLRGLVDEGAIMIEDRVIFVRSLARLRPYD